MQGSFGKKPLFGIYDEMVLNLVKGVSLFTKNTRKFMETVKVIMKQEGLVMKSLKAQIYVAKDPVHFVVIE
jgi:hypothetical protein